LQKTFNFAKTFETTIEALIDYQKMENFCRKILLQLLLSFKKIILHLFVFLKGFIFQTTFVSTSSMPVKSFVHSWWNLDPWLNEQLISKHLFDLYFCDPKFLSGLHLFKITLTLMHF